MSAKDRKPISEDERLKKFAAIIAEIVLDGWKSAGLSEAEKEKRLDELERAVGRVAYGAHAECHAECHNPRHRAREARARAEKP